MEGVAVHLGTVAPAVPGRADPADGPGDLRENSAPNRHWDDTDMQQDSR
jgi:hypothetical protein